MLLHKGTRNSRVDQQIDTTWAVHSYATPACDNNCYHACFTHCVNVGHVTIQQQAIKLILLLEFHAKVPILQVQKKGGNNKYLNGHPCAKHGVGRVSGEDRRGSEGIGSPGTSGYLSEGPGSLFWGSWTLKVEPPFMQL